jgi:hypothetical protein
MFAIIFTQNDQKLVKTDGFLCVRGLLEGVLRARNAAFLSFFGFFWIRDVLGGLAGVAWAFTGPWKQWGLAKHIAKPSKQQNQNPEPSSPLR